MSTEGLSTTARSPPLSVTITHPHKTLGEEGWDSSSDGPSPALTSPEELSSAWKIPPSLVEGGRERPRRSDWAPKVGYDDKGGNEAISVGMPSFVAGQ